MTDNYPKIIYKYRDWNNKFHKNILLKNEVFMSSPDDFNDPFDCRVPKNFFLLNSPEKIEQYIENGIEQHKRYLLENGLNVEFEKKQLRGRLKDIETYQAEHEELEFGTVDQHYGVLSMAGRWNSILMWSHYGDFHKGFCVGFNEEKMRNSGLFGKGGPVTYLTDFPLIDPLDDENLIANKFKQTHHKAKDWEYEEEYRLINLFFPHRASNEDRTITIPENFIEEVILGLKINEQDKSDILAECNTKKIKVYQAHKIRSRFELNRIEI